MADKSPLVIDAGKVRQAAAGDVIVCPGITNSALTSGRVVLAGASGVLEDNAVLTFDGTTLVAPQFSGGGASITGVVHNSSEVDHGEIVGLGDDDHTQYHNDTRAATWLSANHETTYNHTNYDTAYGWGDHSTAGYVTSSCCNLLINGGFDYFQRQVPATLTSRADDTYGPDRWVVLTQTAAVQSARSTGASYSTNAGQLKQNQAAAQRMGFLQIVEAVDSKPLRGKPTRFQAKVKCSANQTIRIAILEWTGTADAVTSDVVKDWTSGTYTANNFFLTSSLTVTAVGSVLLDANVWTDISVSGTISTSCNNLIVFIWTDSTAAQNVTLGVTEAGLYHGSAAVDWQPRLSQQEFALCQRYYEKSYNLDAAPQTVTADGFEQSEISSIFRFYAPFIKYLVIKRVAVDPVIYSYENGTTNEVSEYTAGPAWQADRDINSALFAATTKGAFIVGEDGDFVVGSFSRWHWIVDAEL